MRKKVKFNYQLCINLIGYTHKIMSKRAEKDGTHLNDVRYASFNEEEVEMVNKLIMQTL